jgi:O-acetyl-ADP-ribose deacetylase (regulator of RNase III)
MNIQQVRRSVLAAGFLLSAPAAILVAQQGPVAAMYTSDQKRDQSLASSFVSLELPASKAAQFPALVFLSAGDLERAFDTPEFRPDAAIVPTNTDLQMTAQTPATQRVLVDRVRRQSAVMRDLEDQVAARRKKPSADKTEPGVLRIGIDVITVQLPRAGGDRTSATFPKTVCLIPTDFPKGGAIDRRELFAQDRFRQGIAACLGELDAAGIRSVALPLMGAASSGTQTNDAQFEGQRVLKECRLINSAAGIALGIHDFAPGRRSLREIGVIQWDQEVAGMFRVPAGSRAAEAARQAYRTFADQMNQAVRKGLAGEKTSPGDVNGSCSAVFSAQ